MSDLRRDNFGLISGIRPDSRGTWERRLFLTLDIDWAADEVLEDSIDLVETARVPATWFVTHDTPLLARLRTNPLFELGIHPNFNFLLSGASRNGDNAADVLDQLLEIVPEAKVVRSHSMTQSSQLLQLFRERGLTHDCNHFIPAGAGMALCPWQDWNGLVKVPYFWEDDVHCHLQLDETIDSLVQRPGLRVFDFHPIHVYLNTEALDRYERTRAFHNDARALLAQRNCSAAGSRRMLSSLLGID